MSQESTRCPICGTSKTQDHFKREGAGWQCKACGFIETDERLDVQDNMRKIYNDLQNGRFEKVLRETARLRPTMEEKYPVLLQWLDYVEMRADFRILGPLVNVQGEDTGCFTPCVIEAFSPELIEKYVSRGGTNRELEDVKAHIRDSSRNYQTIYENYRRFGLRHFDVFLCHKTDDGGKQNTADYKIAKQMYDALKKEGKEVFFAPETKKTAEGMRTLGEYNNSWREWIYDAMLASKIMVVVATKEEYFTSPNLANEWVTFRSFKQDGYYGEKMILPVFAPACANECLRLLYEGDDAAAWGDSNRYENYYPNFFAKGKFDKKVFVNTVMENLARLKGNDRPFDVDVAQLYAHAVQVEADNRDEAIKLHKNVWKRFRYPSSAVRLGLLSHDREEAVRWFKLAKSPVGDAYLAVCTYNGYGVAQDVNKAFEMLERNADPIAVYHKALFVVKEVMSGANEPFGKNDVYVRNCVRELKSLHEALTPARVLYGLCLYLGIGVTKNEEHARKFLRGTDVFEQLFDDE